MYDPRSTRMYLPSSHLDGQSCSWIEPVDSCGREIVARRSANSFKRRSSHWLGSCDIPMICVSLQMVSVAMAICSLRYVMHWWTMEKQDALRRLSKELCKTG